MKKLNNDVKTIKSGPGVGGGKLGSSRPRSKDFPMDD